MQEKIEGLNAKATVLEAALGKVKVKMVVTTETSIAEFKESDTYKWKLNMTIA